MDVHAGPDDDWNPARENTFVSILNAFPRRTLYGHDFFITELATRDFSILTDRYFTAQRSIEPKYQGKDHVVFLCDHKTADEFEKEYGDMFMVLRSQTLAMAKGHGQCLKFLNWDEPPAARYLSN